jgi:GR25 family glycosyltransferase involved in LPS biosynthesis
MKQNTFVILVCILLAVTIANAFVNSNRDIEGFDQELDVNQFQMFLINLKKRTDRLQVTSQRLKEFGYNNVLRVDAVDGYQDWGKYKHFVDPGAMESIMNGYRTDDTQLSKGAVGCSLSHFKLWNFLAKSDKEAFIIFEDDTSPTLTYNDVKKKINKAPSDWDIILFGALYNDCINIDEHFCRINRFMCTHAYAIRKKTAAYLLENGAFPIKQQIDAWISDLSQSRTLNVYAIRNSNWLQNDEINSTDIQIPLISKE